MCPATEHYTDVPHQLAESLVATDPGAAPLTLPPRADRSGPPTLVLGLGNPLMGDDGVGLAALGRLAAERILPPEVQLVDGGTWGLQLLPHIEDAERLLLLDAIEAGATPGELVVLERDTIPRFFAHKFSPHEVGLREVLALAELRGRLPRELVAIGLQPGTIALAPGLSPEVEAGLGPMLAAVVARLEAWGYSLPPALSVAAGPCDA